MFSKKIFIKNHHVNGLVSSISTSYNIYNPCPLHSNTRIQVWNDHTKLLLTPFAPTPQNGQTYCRPVKVQKFSRGRFLLLEGGGEF